MEFGRGFCTNLKQTYRNTNLTLQVLVVRSKARETVLYTFHCYALELLYLYPVAPRGKILSNNDGHTWTSTELFVPQGCSLFEIHASTAWTDWTSSRPMYLGMLFSEYTPLFGVYSLNNMFLAFNSYVRGQNIPGKTVPEIQQLFHNH